MLKMTGVNLDKITDIDKYLMVENFRVPITVATLNLI